MSRCSFSHTANVDQPGLRAFDDKKLYLYTYTLKYGK